MGNPGFNVDLEALKQASDGVGEAIGALEAELPWPMKQMGNDGEGVAMMNLDEGRSGSAAVSESLNEFCRRWNYGVKFMVEEGASVSAALSDTRSDYEKLEAGVTDLFKQTLVSLLGAPNADLKQAGRESFAQLGVDAAPDPMKQGLSEGFNELGADTKVKP
ncbi:hypothetical protein [Saccharopolyspora taberi]|uniref:Uncharacterized protein n=1 Tax=Saccharopolyspora taberi TaxID=60895 RepID=A0ABN3VL06_9PSEU